MSAERPANEPQQHFGYWNGSRWVYRPRLSRLEELGIPHGVLGKLLLLILATLVSVLFVSRPLLITADDQNYLSLFSHIRPWGHGLVAVVVDEPTFKLLTNFLAPLDVAKLAVRALIALTLLPHIWFAFRLETKRAWIYLIGYFGFVELAAQVSFVQLRQGFAMAALLLLLSSVRDRASVFCAAFMGLFHTALLVITPCFGLQWIRNIRISYAIIFMLAAILLLMPGILTPLIGYFGRRQAVYLWKGAIYSPAYLAYSVSIIIYVTAFVWDPQAKRKFVAYHAMCALILPLFVLPTFGAFAERLYFIVRWYELYLVASSQRRRAVMVGVGYLAINLSYTFYHSIHYYGVGGWFDRAKAIGSVFVGSQ